MKDGAAVVDVAMNRVAGKLVGDVDFESRRSQGLLHHSCPGRSRTDDRHHADGEYADSCRKTARPDQGLGATDLMSGSAVIKSEIRERALRARRSIPRADLLRDSRTIKEQLMTLEEYEGSRVVASYVAKDDEVQTKDIIIEALASGKRVRVPRTDAASGTLLFYEIHGLNELAVGHFGIWNPGPHHHPLRSRFR